MEKRANYYVSAKDVLIWLAAFLIICSAGFRIAYFCEKGADTTTVWFQIILPVIAAILYAVNILFDGKEHFYRTAFPLFLIVIYLGQHVLSIGMHMQFVLMHWIVYLALWVLYRQITAGYYRRLALLCVMWIGICAYFLYETKAFYLAGTSPLHYLMRIPDLMFALGLLCTCLAIRTHNDGIYHPTWGDRPDGRRLRTLSPMAQVTSYIMPNRNGASNLLRDSIEITALDRYIRQKRKDGLPGLGIIETIMAAYVRCVARYPGCNRFLAGQKVYSRGDDIQVCMVVKKEMHKDAPDTVIKLHLTPNDTVEDIYHKFRNAVAQVQDTQTDSFFDAVAGALSTIPGVFLKFTVWFLKTLDYFGLLPKVLLEVSPFHGSIFFTSMGSLGIPPIFHHLYDFGNLPVFCAFGCKRRELETQTDGSVLLRRYVDYTFTLDERTVDGFYYAEALKYFRRLLKEPTHLDEPIEVFRDID